MTFRPPKTLEEYAANRDQLLEQIIHSLKKDERIAAAWLIGSFGRNEEDSVSDLDLTVIVNTASAEALCAHSHQVGAGTTRERYALLSQFGQPHIIHENHHNVPADDGTFTFVLYKETALAVDWVLIPNVNVMRPALSVLLFDKVNIPAEPPISVENLNKRIELAAEQVAFFWLMAAVTVKYLIRQDALYFHKFLDMLHGILWTVRRLVAGEPDRWIRGSLVKMAVARETQITSVRQVCQEMMDIMLDVEKLGGTVPISPMSTIEILLHFVESNVDEGANV